MQARILCFRLLEILGLVCNFELNTFPQDGELWIEMLSQRGWNFCFWSKSPPYPVIPPWELLARYKMAAYSVRTRQVSGDHYLVLQAMALKFVFLIVVIRLFSSFLILKGCIFNGWNTHRSLLLLLSRQNICYCFSIWKNGYSGKLPSVRKILHIYQYFLALN